MNSRINASLATKESSSGSISSSALKISLISLNFSESSFKSSNK